MANHKFKKQGKVKAIPVKEVVTEGMQVGYISRQGKFEFGKVIKTDIIGSWLIEIAKNLTIPIFTKELKTLVVEYRQPCENPSPLRYNWDTIIQLPIAETQWHSVINKVDSNRLIEFEITQKAKCDCGIDPSVLNTEGCLGGMDCKAVNAQYALVSIDEKISIEQFNQITDLRLYLLNHPDKEMVRAACLHFLGDKFQEIDKADINLLAASHDLLEACEVLYKELMCSESLNKAVAHDTGRMARAYKAIEIGHKAIKKAKPHA